LQISVTQHAVALTLALIDILVRARRIRVLLPGSIWSAALINTCGDALAGMTPARWGGEPLRFLAFRHGGASGRRVFAAFATELCVDAVVILIIGLVLGRWVGMVSASWMHRVAILMTPPVARVVAIVIIGVTALGIVLVGRLRRLLGPRHSYAGWLHDAFRRAPAILIQLSLWTAISMVSRAALLPVLAASVPGTNLGTLFVGSFTLLFAQSFLPMPGGAGVVDVAFAALFTPALVTRAVGQLLLAWRFYTWGLAALAATPAFWVSLRRGVLKRAPREPATLGQRDDPQVAERLD